MGVRIVSVGAYVPERVLTNQDLEQMVDTSDQWIVERTGIRERRIAADHEATSDLAYHASVRALARAGLQPEDLDMVVVGTATPDMLFPATACLVQARLGIQGRPCFDVEAGCPGFVFTLEVARAMLSLNNGYRRILVVGADTLSRITDWTDRNTCVLFGDGAGAVVVERHDGDRGILATVLGGDGTLGDLLYLPAGGSRKPASPETVANREHYLRMEGREVFRHAVLRMQEASLAALEKAGLRPEEVDWLVPHQANWRIIDATAKRLNLPPEKVYVNIDRYGNTSAASIPLALDEMVERGLLREGQIVLLVAFGAGFTWGATVIRW